MKVSVGILALVQGLVCFNGPGAAWAADQAGKEPASFLFIGNSFTFRHELKDLFVALAKEGNPGADFRAERITYGGRDMFRHFALFRSQDLLCLQSMPDDALRASMREMAGLAGSAVEPSFYTAYWKDMGVAALRTWGDGNVPPTEAKGPANRRGRWDEDRKSIKSAIGFHETWIRERASFPKKWDYVSLQSWQDVTCDPATGYAAWAARFAEKARAQGTRVILYLTAPFCQNQSPVSAPIEPARAIGETRAAAALAKRIDAIVVPVPLAIYLLQKDGTPLAFRYVNDGHPNQRCAYLTACLFYAAVFGRSPEGLKLSEVTETKIVDRKRPGNDPDGQPLRCVFPDDERLVLQRAAWRAAEAFKRGDY